MFYYTPYILLPLFSAAVTASLAIAIYRQRRRSAARQMFRIMVIMAVWSFSYALNTAATTLPLKLFFYKTATTFAPFLGVFTLALAMEVLGYGAKLTRSRLALLAAIPAAVVALAWTPEYGNLLRYDHHLFTSGPLLLLGFRLGPLWAPYYLYLMALFAASVALFLVGVRRGPAGYRVRYAIIIVGIVVTVMVDVLDLTPVKGFRMVTSILWFTGGCYALAIYRHRLFHVAPIARAMLFDYLGDPVLVFDRQGSLVDCNRAAKILLGPSLSGLSELQAAAWSRFPTLPTQLANPAFALEDCVQDLVDTERYWRMKTLPLSAGERTIGCLVQLHDITSLKQGEQELRRARDAAEAASRAKTAFLANISHEIRTPMNAIIGMTELTLESPLSQEQREHLAAVKRSSEALLSVLNNVLDYSKIEADMVALEEIDFDLNDLIGRTIGTLALQAREKGLLLECVIAPGTPGRLRGDPVKLHQVLLNLIGNAIKFTDRGSVTLSVGSDAAAGRDVVPLSFAVADTGIGIPSDKLDEIFNTFTQADGSITRRYGGSGLGLSIVRRLVGLMGGEVHVRSEQGKGSVFSFMALFKPSVVTVPADVQPESDRSAAARPANVLVAEDIETNRVLMKLLLERRGHRVSVVKDGGEAVQALAAEPFDVVLLDVQMPGVDGLEAARMIRDPRSPVLRHDVPIIAVTAHAMNEDRERCLAAGMDGYLAKPIIPYQLFRAVEQYAPEGGEQAPTTGEKEQEAATGPSSPAEKLTHRLAVRYSNDRALAGTIVRTFLEESPRLLRNIREAAASQDLPSLQLHAHSLKSAAATVGLESLREKASRLEQAARSGVHHDADTLSRGIEEELSPYLNGRHAKPIADGAER